MFCVTLVGIFCSSAPIAAFAQNIGLAERRAIAAYATDIWPKYELEIQDLAGFPVTIDLNTKSLALPGLADSYASDDYLRKPIIDPILQAIGTITVTETGRAALKEGLKSIVIHYDETSAPSSNYKDGLKMEDGVLTINWKPYTNVDDVEPRALAILSVIESAI
ncbi:hypothetical protein CEV33_3562 [Brucella grignonensis]|uniref:Uncharacterized protein n=1 Tax=Brucella grignonensis TaxID=94627 RepID=A0A256EZ26_9HYPH|nr:hypothetical protein [Brucella grignonensis]OYR07773.1 hypothetical protein CEV33_3562 [Brucella grignonensis]